MEMTIQLHFALNYNDIEHTSGEQLRGLKSKKSGFIEMLGDPIRNDNGWEIKKLGEANGATRQA